ncbi:unnamed protein product, partial [Heligmosomoides polygyrus]|uniref:C2H2-type domain-containing protein n=1 Tax=Heligmosomoides polygyrus TaxID=6339 RepID=A0A183GMD2_HELPZ
RQFVSYRNKGTDASASFSISPVAYSQAVVEEDASLPRLVEETSTSRAACSSGIVRIPVARNQQSGRYLLRIPKGEIESKSPPSSFSPRRILIPTVPPSMSMGGECSADEYEIIYEGGDSPACLAEMDAGDDGYYPLANKRSFYCSEMTCFWHGSTQASLRRHVMITHNRKATSNAAVPQATRRSSKPKGVKCSECDEMAYSRPLLLRHMTQAHGIVAPLIYKTFSDREKLQIWLEQLRETHAIEFVVSSGSKKWGQGLQVRFCSINCHTFVTMVVF